MVRIALVTCALLCTGLTQALPATAATQQVYSFGELVTSLPVVDPLSIGYQSTEQFIPSAVANKRDRNGCNLRQRMIIALASVKPKVTKGCRMSAGKWIVDGGTRTVTSTNGFVLVPAMSYKRAWGEGAYAWTAQQRLAWATNLGASGPKSRAKAMSIQGTQSLYTVQGLKAIEEQARNSPVYAKYRECIDQGGGVLGCLPIAALTATALDANSLSWDCQATARSAANAKAWGLAIDQATYDALVESVGACRKFGLISITDEASALGIPVIAPVTAVPSTLPDAEATGAVRLFDGYGSPVGPVISTRLFGLHAPIGFTPPTVTAGYLRLWDSDVSWRDVETADNVYDWRAFDAAMARAGGTPVMYVLGNTPAWANDGQAGNVPPNNQAKAAEFISAVCQRYGSRISSYEAWNEGNLTTFWTGYMTLLGDLTRVVSEAVRGCGTGAEVVASSAGARADGGFATRYKDYLSSLREFNWPVDAYAVHSYPAADGGPAQRIEELGQFKAMLSLTGAPAKPVYDTELNYGLAGPGPSRPRVPIDDRLGAAWLSQTFIQSAQYGVDSAFWYLWTTSDYSLLGMQFNPGTPYTNMAWTRTQSWLVGARMQRCSAFGSLAGCQLTDSRGVNATLLWSSTDAPAVADITGLGTMCTTLDDSACNRSGNTVTVGAAPVEITTG